MEPYFTIIIPTTSRAGSAPTQLADCLTALTQQTLPTHQFEVVVVDDAANETTATLVAAFARHAQIEARYLAQPKRTGLAAARNRGWHAARGRYLAFADDDCLPQPNWLSAAAVMFQRGAQVITGTLRTQGAPVVRNGQRGTYRSTTSTHDTNDFVAANCFIQKPVLQRAGGFEESFDLAWRVDADLQFKLLEIGVPILKCPEAVVVRPYQPATWYTTLTNERQTRYDALLYKRHPDLFRQRVPRDEKLALRYYVTVMSMLVGLVAALLGNVPVALFSLLGFVGLTTWLTIERWPTSSASWRDARTTLLTALAIPFISAYWRLYGAVKYRVLYW
ncbi:glycosyltransferase family 2 protein [Fibrella sp. WM1]|uniref:glycosyltransferase family 2 protein n=1 Tax=Fibrella musci TaxID=3242485 RepID=UPI003521BD1D